MGQEVLWKVSGPLADRGERACPGHALDGAVGGWLASQDDGAPATAVDGKILRGTCDDMGQGGVHLLAAMTHDSAIVVAQREVDGKTNEITCFQPLLSTMDMNGVV